MFQVKICGITRVEDALIAADAGADAIGLNFFAKSPRYVSRETAREIIEAHGKLDQAKRPQVIGVFVNEEPEKLLEAIEDLGLDGVQLHGDEPPEAVAMLSGLNSLLSFALDPTQPGLAIIRAFRCRDEGLGPVSEYLCQCESMRPEQAAGLTTMPHAVLLDAYTPGAYGGTGQVVDWSSVRRDRDLLMGLPVILAGGLTAENVAEAIETARPTAVDTASGVEEVPGRKSEDKIRHFVAAAREAFERIKSLT